MSTYCTRADIESIFGRQNVAEWAKLGPEDDDRDIADRITAKCELASTELNARLAGVAYALPFVAVAPAELPIEVVDAAARLAGVLLYEARALDDADDQAKHKLSGHEKKVEQFVNRVRTGRWNVVGIARVANGIPAALDFS